MPPVAVVVLAGVLVFAAGGAAVWFLARRKQPAKDPAVELVKKAIEKAEVVVEQGKARHDAIPEEKANEIRDMDADALIALNRRINCGGGGDHGGSDGGDGA